MAQCDFYKTNHYQMYPEGTTKIYSNLTPRKSRLPGVKEVVVFGIQYFLIEYLIKQWKNNFFDLPKNIAVNAYKRLMNNTLGKDAVSMEHIEKLHDLGYLPLKIKALPEGTLCPIGVPCLTITNTVDHAFWLVNYLETILSCTVWQPMTSATIAYQYRKLLNKYALETTGSTEFVQWQGHDFSMRGMSSLESACLSGAGHLLSFTGTDTVPAITFLEQYYFANSNSELIGSSVPATEHSVMCMGLKDGEVSTFSRLLDLYPAGILSVVSDTWDLWNVVKRGGICEQLKDKILARDGKLVIRPDSGDPVDIICGTGTNPIYNADKFKYGENTTNLPEWKGVIELLWDIFGGTINKQGYKVLDSHIGAIYGDSITLERAEAICERLKAKGFASTNIVFGIGSFTYQYNTRDTFGFAVKATYGEVIECGEGRECTCSAQFPEGCVHPDSVGREIFKDPITDSGEKKSARGLLRVDYNEQGQLTLYQQQTKEQEEKGALRTVFLDGNIVKSYSLAFIREKLSKVA